MSTDPNKARPFTEVEIEMMMRTYGRVLTWDEFVERRYRFVSTDQDVSIDPDGIMRIR